MDIFGTVITAGTIILDFIGACAAYSDDAKSLKVRFEWDLRALETVQKYFEKRQTKDAIEQLSPRDVALLQQTEEYLIDIVGKVQKSSYKIKSKGFLHGVINRGMWLARQAELKELANEIFLWTQRFDVRVLGLPSEVRSAISISEETPAIVKSNDKLRGFLSGASTFQEKRAEDLKHKDPAGLAHQIFSRGDFCFEPLQIDEAYLVFASRPVLGPVLPEEALAKLDSEMGVLAASLNCLDPAADIRLLKVDSYFYHADSMQFIFCHESPYPVDSTNTLESIIRGDIFPHTQTQLDQRFKLAYKLSEAVFFLHTAGFVHKNITSSSVIRLERFESTQSSLEHVFLMGFDLIRGVNGRTSDRAQTMLNDPQSIWDYDIFQHGHRLSGQPHRRYTQTYDVYSLGVVLLEIGFWEPLSTTLKSLDETKPSEWPQTLLRAASALGPRAGGRYKQVVVWCLSHDGTEVVGAGEFAKHVLDPLEDIVSALA